MSYEDVYFDAEKRKIALHFRSLKELLDAIALEKKALDAVREDVKAENIGLERIKESSRQEEQRILKMKNEFTQEFIENGRKISDLKSEITVLENDRTVLSGAIGNLNINIARLENHKKLLIEEIGALEGTKQATADLTEEKKNLENEIGDLKKRKSEIAAELQAYDPEIAIKRKEIIVLNEKKETLDKVLGEKSEALDIINAMIKVSMKRDKVRQMKEILEENYGKDS